MKKHILIVEDEAHLAEALSHNLGFEGYTTTVAHDGEEGLELAQTIQFDLVILDIMMPKLDGLEVCRRLRATGNRVPILFLTAKSSDADRLLGLKVGADDYLAKPFLLEELILRIQGIFRRQEWYGAPPEEQEVFRFDGNEINFRTYEATAKGRTVRLTEKDKVAGNLFVQTGGEQRVCAGQIHKFVAISGVIETSLCPADGFAGPVTRVLAKPRKGVENGAFAGIGVSR